MAKTTQKTPKKVASPKKATKKTAKTPSKSSKPLRKKFGNANPVCVGSGDKIMLLESPSKINAVSKYLGAGWRVMATFGHCIDLPEGKLNIDTKTWDGAYGIIPSKADVVKRIRQEVKTATEVYLGTDPDREGEAIAWLVYEAAKSANPKAKWYRTAFNAITKDAITKSIQKKASINMDLVYAQRVRRFLDKLVGYGVSPLLSRNIFKSSNIGLSAGRVQSVALRILTERQQEIDAFKPEEYWEIFANASIASHPIKMQLVSYKGKTIKIHNQAEAEQVVNNLNNAAGKVVNVKETEISRQPKPPLTTVTMQQIAASQLGYSIKNTMDIAQELFAKAFISYHRSDSTRLEPEQIQSAQDVLKKDFGAKYTASSPVHYKSKSRSKVQDAHTAIQPTHPEIDQIMGTEQMKKLYTIIRNRFLACQSVPAKFKSKLIVAQIGDYEFKATGSTMLFDGYLKVMGIDDDEEDKDVTKIPDVAIGAKVSTNNIETKQKFTQPPAYFNDASLVKTLEANGVGRPSTYATILDKLEEREYIQKDGKKMVVTSTGRDVSSYLVQNFEDIFNVGFTAEMETKLDLIEDASVKWKNVLTDFWNNLSPRIKAMSTNKAEDTGKICPKCQGKILKRTGFKGPYYECETLNCKVIDKRSGTTMNVVGECPKCGKSVVEKPGKYGNFLACSGYPDCKAIFTLENGVLTEKEKGQKSQQTGSSKAVGKCPKCGADVIEKMGKFGAFLSCSAYPDCSTICIWDDGNLVEKARGQKTQNSNKAPGNVVGKCPKCGADVMEKNGQYGIFFSCSAYPKCRTICVWDNGTLVEKVSKNQQANISQNNDEDTPF